MRYFTMVSLLALAGCAGQIYHKAGASEAQTVADSKTCEYEALKATKGEAGLDAFNVHQLCMEQKGYN